MRLLAYAVVVFLVAAPDMVVAKNGDGGHASGHPKTFYAIEWKYYGLIVSRPDALQGDWVIGDRTFYPNAKTKFDQSEGALTVGSCAKVQVRNDRVRKIERRPQENCR
jgi:hypothetical protein